jgi:hypothetical protein
MYSTANWFHFAAMNGRRAANLARDVTRCFACEMRQTEKSSELKSIKYGSPSAKVHELCYQLLGGPISVVWC